MKGSRAKKYYSIIHKQNEEITRNLTGLFRATVVENGEVNEQIRASDDVTKTGRCRVRVHAIHDEKTAVVELPWAEVCSIGAAPDQGIFWVPEKKSSVYVMFVNGNSSSPVIVGSMWNFQANNSEAPAASYFNQETVYPKNHVFRTKTGNMIEMDDSPLNKGVRITTSNGNIIHLEDSDDNTLNVHFKGDINMSCDGKFNLTASDDINLKTKKDLNIEAGEDINIATKDVNLSGSLNQKGDHTINKGNIKLMEGDFSMQKPGNLVINGNLLVDKNITSLGSTYIHKELVVDGNIYTKKSFFDRFDKVKQMYTNFSKWYRNVRSWGNLGFPTTLIKDDENNYKKPKLPLI